MAFESSEFIDNENCLSLLIQILERDSELYPVFYIASGEEVLSIDKMQHLSMGLAHAKFKIDKMIEIMQNG